METERKVEYEVKSFIRIYVSLDHEVKFLNQITLIQT